MYYGDFQIDPDKFDGKPYFAGTSVPVDTVADYLAADRTLQQFLDDFPVVRREAAERIVDAFRQGERQIYRKMILGAAKRLPGTDLDFEAYTSRLTLEQLEALVDMIDEFKNRFELSYWIWATVHGVTHSNK